MSLDLFGFSILGISKCPKPAQLHGVAMHLIAGLCQCAMQCDVVMSHAVATKDQTAVSVRLLQIALTIKASIRRLQPFFQCGSRDHWFNTDPGGNSALVILDKNGWRGSEFNRSQSSCVPAENRDRSKSGALAAASSCPS